FSTVSLMSPSFPVKARSTNFLPSGYRFALERRRLLGDVDSPRPAVRHSQLSDVPKFDRLREDRAVRDEGVVLAVLATWVYPSRLEFLDELRVELPPQE